MAQPQQPSGWLKLKCECGSEEFYKTYWLRWKAGGGQVEEPAAWVCTACDGRVDGASLQRLAALAEKRRELRQAEQELEEMTPPAKEKTHAGP